MKLEVYGCTYKETIKPLNLQFSPCIDITFMKDLEFKTYKDEEYEFTYVNYFLPDYTKRIHFNTYDVERFNPNEDLLINGSKFKIIEHVFDPKNNKQVALIDLELKRIKLTEQQTKEEISKIMKRAPRKCKEETEEVKANLLQKLISKFK